MNSQISKKTSDMVKLALLAAIIVVLAMTPLGFVPLGVIKATTVHIPVIIGSILLGWKSGAVLGGLFGLTSLINNTVSPALTSFVFTPFYSVGDMNGNFWSLVVCFVPRILVGIVPYFVYKLFVKVIKNQSTSFAIAGFAGSMTNTLLVMNFIYIFFGQSWGAAKNIPVGAVYATIIGVIGTQGVPEAIVASILTVSLCKVLLKVMKNSVSFQMNAVKDKHSCKTENLSVK